MTSLSAAGRSVFEGAPVQTSDGWREAAGVRSAVSAVAALLRRHDRGEIGGDVVDAALAHVLVSIDAPCPERTTLRLSWRGEDRPFRDVVALLARWPMKHIGTAIAQIHETWRWFDVDATAADGDREHGVGGGVRVARRARPAAVGPAADHRGGGADVSSGAAASATRSDRCARARVLMSFSLSKYARWLAGAGPQLHEEGLRETEGVRLVVAAAATLLRRQARGDVRDVDVDEAFLHALLSVDAPRADRVHLQLKLRGEVRPFRDVVDVLSRWPKQHIGGAIAGIETGTWLFDVDAKEAYAKVVSIYTINWSNFMPYAPSVRARFLTDPPEAQQGFLRVFLDLYDEGTDVTHLPGADTAARWLRAQQRCRGEQTLVLHDDVDAADVVATTTDRVADAFAMESELHEALAAFAEIVDDTQRALLADFKTTTGYREYAHEFVKLAAEHWPTDLRWMSQQVNDVVTGVERQRRSALAELLSALLVPPPQIALSTLAADCAGVVEQSLPYEPRAITEAALPAIVAARERLARAAGVVLERGC